MIARAGHDLSRRGITLTVILIANMFLGVGMVSLATLFPIGLLRMRDAARYSRTKVLVDSVSADGTARTLLNPNSFALVDASQGSTTGLMDAINWKYNPPTWWWDPEREHSGGLEPADSGHCFLRRLSVERARRQSVHDAGQRPAVRV